MDRPWVMIRSSREKDVDLNRLATLMKAAGPAPSWYGASSDYYRWQIPDLSVYSAQVDTYRTRAWVRSSVSITAQQAATVPLMVKILQGEDRKDVENHPFELLLNRPNPDQSRFEFLRAAFSFWRLSGSGYLWLNRSSASQPPTEMWTIPSNRIKPVPDGKLSLRGYLYEPGGTARKIPLESWEVMHLKDFNPINPYVGLSPVEAVGPSIIGDRAMAEYNAQWFDDDNAKISGILGFSDPIEDGEWKRLQAQVKADYGGTRRALMMLRGLGKGDVKWIETGMSQKDMEFIQGREFNMKEIYNIFAPGLYAMLHESANVANARSNEAIFMSKTIWPMLVAMAEKFTNDILPSYGDNLICEFKDIRVRDRQMDLAEQEQAGKVQTVGEIRQHFYNLPLLGDERDNLLVTQAGSPFGGTGNNPFTGDNKLPQLDNGKKEESPKDEPVKARVEVRPTKAQLMRDELSAWERFVVKRLKKGQESWREFKAEFIPSGLYGAIEGGLETVSTPEGARLVFADAERWHGYP